jgi:hypothetical protein
MVGATRGTPESFRADQASGSQQPPPAPPNLAEVMARQMELLNQLVQAQMNQSHHPSRGYDEHPSAGYQGPVRMNGKEKEKVQNFCSFALFLHFWIQTPQSAKGQMLP